MLVIKQPWIPLASIGESYTGLEQQNVSKSFSFREFHHFRSGAICDMI